MPTLRAVAALAVVLLPTALADEYVPVHKRFSYVRDMDDFSFLGMLSKRDACSDAFGSDAHNSNCAPDFTLCCTRDRQVFPSCQQLLGKGWCCVGDGETDKCYVDQTSACDEDSAVQCTNLKQGTSEACCPKLTTCDPRTEASEDFVRCNINRSDLLNADAAQKDKDTESTTSSASSTSSVVTSSETSSVASTTSSSSSTTTDPAESGDSSGAANKQNSGDSKDDGGVSGGTIAGAVVGGVAGLGLLAGLIFFLMRRRKQHQYQAASQGQPTIPQFYEDQAAKQYQQGYYPQQSVSPHQGYMYSPPPGELHDSRTVAELESSSHPQQLDSRPVDYNR